MKKIVTFLATVFITLTAVAQVPQKMSYQAVIRNSSNALVSNAPVGMQISILQNSATGTAVYVETQVTSTNSNGLVSIEIGSGTPVTGTFSGIDWSMGPYFIKTETDPTGGTSYTISSTNQLLSVPFALYAEKAGNATPGVDGKTILNGAVDPVGATGTDGDFYLNTATNKLYGPKTSGAWGSGVSLVGPQGMNGTNGTNGTNGADGKTILNGTITPAGGTGVDGDFYLNTATNMLYGPKASGAWGSGVSLVGPQGMNGTNGTNGVDGKTILNGTITPAGGTGVDGDFYLNTTTNMLYGPKTSGAWGSGVSLVGPQGMNGTNGTNGINGVDGKTILNGVSDPTGGTGVDGDFYLNTSSNKLFGPKASGTWSSGVSLIGPAGPGYPTQTGNSGKFLTTDGTNVSWGTVGGSDVISKVMSVSANYTLTTNDILVYSTTGGIKYTLPLASSVPAGRVYYMLSLNNTGCTVKTQGSDVMRVPYSSATHTDTGVSLNAVGSITALSDGSSTWILIGFN